MKSIYVIVMFQIIVSIFSIYSKGIFGGSI